VKAPKFGADLYQGCGSEKPFPGSATLNDDHEKQLEWYDTKANKGGEIRGQLTKISERVLLGGRSSSNAQYARLQHPP
jgi:hypothetical protein